MKTVHQRQQDLRTWYYYYKGNSDGIQGPQTKTAYKNFQKDNGLTVDGIYGTKTEAKLIEVIKNMQTLLNNKGYNLVIDGYVGDKTISALKDFQKNNGLTVDGICGKNTMAKLTSSNNTMKLMFPVPYIGITQPYKAGKHNGIDLGWNSNYGGQKQPILAPYDGTVVAIRNTYATQDKTGNSYGNYVKIDHGNGIMTLSAHLTKGSVSVKVGEKVKRGQQVGVMGTTGHSFGYHDHFEVFKNGNKVDPLNYLYVYPNQTVGASTKKEYNLRYID